MINSEMFHIDIVAHFIRQDPNRTFEELYDLSKEYLIGFMTENELKQHIKDKMAVIKKYTD